MLIEAKIPAPGRFREQPVFRHEGGEGRIHKPAREHQAHTQHNEQAHRPAQHAPQTQARRALLLQTTLGLGATFAVGIGIDTHGLREFGD